MNDSMSVVLYRIDPPKPAAQRTPFGDQTWPRSCPTARAPPSFVRMQCAEVGPRELSEAEKLPSTWCKARFDFSCGQKTAKMTQPQPMEITLPDLLLNHKLHFIIGQFNSFFRY